MEGQVKPTDLKKVSDVLYEVPQSFRNDMRVPARFYLDEEMLAAISNDRSLDQLVNVTTLPGIQKAAYAMPDMHQGYGFPIGGVAAMALDEGGVISPGGIGYDINCGVRLLASSITYDEIKPHLESLATNIYHTVPSGVGKGSRFEVLPRELDAILQYGSPHMVKLGYGFHEDYEMCESGGCLSQADPAVISDRAKERGKDQLGTLGSGNHFLEIQRVDEIFNESVAKTFGLFPGHIVVMIHCGSRGLGHQTCTDHVRSMVNASAQWGYNLPDRELACAPFYSDEGQRYMKAMSAAANYAWANRHMIGHWVRESFTEVIGGHAQIKTVYDVCHNIGKVEKHVIDGVEKSLIVHRKGATRAFGPGHPELPLVYATTGHPVFVPGTMGTSSYVMVGPDSGMNEAFGSCCHGAGRRFSRSEAKRKVHGGQLREQLIREGIIIRSRSDVGLAEEAPLAYKDVDNVASVVVRAGLARMVARLKPLAVIKGD